MKPEKSIGMNHRHRHLRVHLVIAVLVKLIVLALLWWFFVRDEVVEISADYMASHMGIPANSQGATK